MLEKLPTVVRTLSGVRDLLPLAAANRQRYPGLLESTAQGGPHARYDILFAFPSDELILQRDGCVRDVRGNDRGAKFLDALDAAWESERSAEGDVRVRVLSPQSSLALPFTGGWLLFLAYELAAEIEPRVHFPVAPDTATPVALALRCPAAIVVDRSGARTHLVAEASAAHMLHVLQSDLETSSPFVAPELPAVALEEDEADRFLAGVGAIKDYLSAGDVFQVNLSR